MIITLNVHGNVHEAMSSIKWKWWVSQILSVNAVSSNFCIVVIRFTRIEDYNRCWDELGYLPDKRDPK